MSHRTPADEPIERHHLATHPGAHALANHLTDIAKLLRSDGATAINAAPLLAARGWPNGTLGDGGSRSTDTTSSTERAAGVEQEKRTPEPGKWDGVDVKLARLLRLIWKTGLDIQELITDIAAHADDVDPIPAGSGTCVCCSAVVRPTPERPEHRIRSGFCPPCKFAWIRARKTNPNITRSDFITRRRADLERINEQLAARKKRTA